MNEARAHWGGGVLLRQKRTNSNPALSNTNKCTHILLNHPSVNTIRNSKMFQPIKCHDQGEKLIRSGNVACAVLITHVTHKTLHMDLYFTTGDTFW